jgi:hypothetical protein
MSNPYIPEQLDQLSKKELLEFARTAHEENVKLVQQLAKANEWVEELEGKHLNLVLWHNLDPQQADIYSEKFARKFAIEQKIEALEELHSFFLNEFDWKFTNAKYIEFEKVGVAVDKRIEQLRKEQEK